MSITRYRIGERCLAMPSVPSVPAPSISNPISAKAKVRKAKVREAKQRSGPVLDDLSDQTFVVRTGRKGGDKGPAITGTLTAHQYDMMACRHLDLYDLQRSIMILAGAEQPKLEDQHRLRL